MQVILAVTITLVYILAFAVIAFLPLFSYDEPGNDESRRVENASQ